MSIAGAWRGLGARLILGWSVGSGTGVSSLRMGTAWIGLLDRTMIPDFPIPDSGIPNSEFRMAYGESRIPHHEIA